jgi:acyltransferase
MTTSKRISWIDTIKALGIFLVVLGHLSIPASISTIIYSFHMPLFFFLSGCTFKPGSNLRVSISARMKKLILPYFFFSIVTYIFWLSIGRHYGRDASMDVDWIIPLLGTFYGNDVGAYLIHNPPLWFLPCLFLTEVGMLLLVTALKGRWLLIASSISLCLGFLMSATDFIRLPWGANVAPISLFFLCMGYLFSNNKYFKLSLGVGQSVILVVVLLIILVLVSGFNTPVDLSRLKFGNEILYLTSSLAGIGLFLILSKTAPVFAFVQYIGRNTLVIFSLHGIALSVIKGVLLYVAGVQLQVYEGALGSNLMLALASIILLLPVAFFLNKVFPVLVGR